VSEGSAGTAPAARDATDEAALKVPMLEAEVSSLREKLAEVQAKREHLRREIDDLRRERDHWQNLAKSTGPDRVGTRTWFCGRALPGK
jgi:FtsZ-binding cell division protein ZapB